MNVIIASDYVITELAFYLSQQCLVKPNQTSEEGRPGMVGLVGGVDRLACVDQWSHPSGIATSFRQHKTTESCLTTTRTTPGGNSGAGYMLTVSGR